MPPSNQQPEPDPLSAWHRSNLSQKARGAVAAVGLGLLTVACIGVLVADNELGTVAVALVGGVLVVIASLGRWPTRISWRGGSAEWAAVPELLIRAVQTEDRSEAEAFLSAARSVAVASGTTGLVESIATLSRAQKVKWAREVVLSLSIAAPVEGMILRATESDESLVDLEILTPEIEAREHMVGGIIVPGHRKIDGKHLLFKVNAALAAGYGALLLLVPSDDDIPPHLPPGLEVVHDQLPEDRQGRVFAARVDVQDELAEAFTRALRALPEPPRSDFD